MNKQTQFEAKLLICSLKLRGSLPVRTRIVPWLRRLVTALSPRRPAFDPGVRLCGICDGQIFPRVFRLPPVSFIPPVTYYTEKWEKTNHLHHRVTQ
jgi:hypothetical protein